MCDESLPTETAPALVDFDVRTHLGRKGTVFYDRCTALAVVACGAALRDADVTVDDSTRSRIGIVLGTTLGSFRSTSDYSRDTLVQDKPYQVNPGLFPNTVMNCAAGQAAIRFGLKGVNATVAGGRLAFHQALKYAANVIGHGYADTMLVGAVEEYSPHRAWATHLTAPGQVAGEAAVVFVVERAERWRRCSAGRPLAKVLSVVTGFGAGTAADSALAGCVRGSLEAASASTSDVDVVLTGSRSDDPTEYMIATEALGRQPQRWAMRGALGDCGAATCALGLGAVLARFYRSIGTSRSAPETALLTARTADGGAAAALVARSR